MIVTVPGISGSDDTHWQTHWETAAGADVASRIVPSSWTAPDLPDWTRAIEDAVVAAGPDTVLVAHSLGCLAVAHWLSHSSLTVAGVFLVAAPDRVGPSFPAAQAPTFRDVVALPLPVPGVLVASQDDPYCSPAAAAQPAAGWTVPLIDAGKHGHLNSASDLGPWPQGRRLLTAFAAGLGLTV